MEVQDVKIELKNVRAVRKNWSLTAEGSLGEGLHLITGSVGSGKSTLALILAGLFPPSQGRVERDRVSSVMLSFQYPEYHVTGSTVEEECSSWGFDPDAILQAVNLTGKNNVSPMNLSRGELKMLHLECILAGHYDLLILDEPFSSLDCFGKEKISRRLSERSDGITLILTHEQAILPRVDYIWEILNGELRACGEPPEAFHLWHCAPAIVKNLIKEGKTPKNLSPEDLREALCRT
jgi:energy-coupling factor transport system ATP-binding protein